MKYKLERWSVSGGIDPYLAPEMIVPRLHGYVYGHPHYPNGQGITTSRILKVEGGFVHTHNSIYELGEIDPLYEKQFPNAKERFLAVWTNKHEH